MKTEYEWEFPLPRTHTGMLQANGTLGAMIWGAGRWLRITLGRADLWDHRGGMPWREGMSYARIRRCLETADEQSLRGIFETSANADGEPERPSVLPLGRVDINLGPGSQLLRGVLDTRDGSVAIDVRRGKRRYRIRLDLAMQSNSLAVSLPRSLARCTVRTVPAWQYVGEYLESISFSPPRRFRAPGSVGWSQSLPADPAVCVICLRTTSRIVLAVERGSDEKHARDAASATAHRTMKQGADSLARSNRTWWARYWRDVPELAIPNERLAYLYRYGMYKFAGFTNPAGVPATLQGPWIEEYRMPPWSSDYHFNINVQMCYQPAYHGNRLEHLLPLFELIFSWEPELRENARVFIGIDDGVMLPHAVDDRCMCMGGFWTGSVDHGCTAWVALMMYRYYRYSADRDFLKRAYAFMVSAMRVYEEMIERDGNRLCLPVGVSPEYRGAQMNAWGKNASFQLACVHALAEACSDAARVLRRKPRPVWARIMAKLPKAALVTDPHDRRRKSIGLWDGLALEESHRHHSHLGAITPFDVIDPDDAEWVDIVNESVANWVRHGPGLWSGWCFSWASALHCRLGNGEAAEFYLDAFDRFFTNEGGGTVHDAWASGFSLIGRGARPPDRTTLIDVMQVDGAMGSVAAIQEMFLHTRRGVNHVFAGIPWKWRNCSFKRMRTDGAFLVSAVREQGRTNSIVVESEAGGTFKFANPWQGAARIRRGRQSSRRAGQVIAIRLAAGEQVSLREA